jgi:hypothetical protein
MMCDIPYIPLASPWIAVAVTPAEAAGLPYMLPPLYMLLLPVSVVLVELRPLFKSKMLLSAKLPPLPSTLLPS